MKKLLIIFSGILLAGCLVIGVMPSLRESVLFKLDQMRLYVRYTLFPPQSYVFVPEQEAQLTVLSGSATATVPTAAPSLTPTTQPSPAIPPSETPTPTPLPTITPTPLPEKVLLDGIRYMHQHGLWNYCGPTNLAMALSFWGWQGDRFTTGDYLKPFREDKSVRAYEMIDYIVNQTDMNVILRYGGTPEMLKNLLANGFPVVIEKGIFLEETLTKRISWAGHYNVVVGYDDVARQFLTRDSYYSPPEYPLDYPISYDEIMTQWRGFNYVFLVIYPTERAEQLNQVMGAYLDNNAAIQIATDIAKNEMETMTGLDQFLATFNQGTNQTLVFDYLAAANTFDQAFALYAQLPEAQRPHRVMWYSSAPYFAYYYTARYQDVINLATTTLEATDKPYLEENWYWRGMARLALGDTYGAISDFETALQYHPGFAPAREALDSLSSTP